MAAGGGAGSVLSFCHSARLWSAVSLAGSQRTWKDTEGVGREASVHKEPS